MKIECCCDSTAAISISALYKNLNINKIFNPHQFHYYTAKSSLALQSYLLSYTILNMSSSSYFVLLTVLLALASSQVTAKVITVTNGGTEGQWGPLERCPPGAKAIGFQTRNELATPIFDDTALNTIVIICNGTDIANITSTEGL